MLQLIRDSKWTKIVSMFLVVVLFTEILQPQQLFAITGGPSQPEMAGFTPQNTDSMVDLFSGDFHYTIPIMTVPGPNGGFPINLNYTSGVGMEHEASWVGLGWNLNPGAINRQVRGVPDDFLNDTIEKIYHRRDNNTFLFSPDGGGEFFGGNFGLGLTKSNSFIYNTYNGITLSQRFGISASYTRERIIEKDSSVRHSNIATVGAALNLDSDNGITTSFSINGGKNLKGGFHYGYNSKSGTYTYGTQISLGFPVPMNVTPTADETTKEKDLSVGAGGIGRSYSTTAGLPPIRIPMSSTNWGVSFQIGGAGAFAEGYGAVNCNIISQTTPSGPVLNPACGILYADKANENSLQDFNREKELCVDHNSRNLPLPVMTNDLYHITGELQGGGFRAYRSDYGHFYDNHIENNTYAPDAGVDLAFGDGTQLGTNLSFTYGESETGDWENENYDTLLTFKDKETYSTLSSHGIHPTLYEPFYFKMYGEQTASDVNQLSDIGFDKEVKFPIMQTVKPTFWGGMCFLYYTINKLSTGDTLTHYEQAERTVRTNSIEYDMNGTGDHRKSHHIAQFSILNANGERFTYGKTLYNYMEKEVTFSIKPAAPLIGQSVITNYDSNLADSNTPNSQRVGKEKLYTCTTTPAYPYSYLLTSITSPDYVDLTGNGPSEDDLGYWVKLGYSTKCRQNTAYCWRFPYKGANYFMGDRSNMNDDIGSYYYGKKEIAYVDTISTKTHYAVFYVSPRDDARGANPDDERMGGFSSGQSRHLFKLDSIKLFSKEDPSVAIKTAVFEYDYSNGKLTLRKLYFKYADNIKGMENPYVFYYKGANPRYAPEKMDRWGNYKGDANYFEHYVTQDADSANSWAGAWLMTGIDLPEGGSITIEYESDDYAYVQDRQAMYMAEVDPSTSFQKVNGKYYIYFKKKPYTEAKDYVTDFKYDLMYFKIAVSYNQNCDPDYIQGYANVASVADMSATVGRIEVKPFPVFDIHPVLFFALQYLKNNRPDLLFNGADLYEDNSDAAAFFRALHSGGIIDKISAMYGKDNFYRHCVASRDYGYLRISSDAMPSYVRLNVPDKIKYGGGCRVKAITLYDNWSKSESGSYRQEYYYRKMENGKLISSGVAEYEPTVGAEENAMRYPVFDETKGLFFIEDEIYSEEPYGESYFPGANVGYSQVIVKTYTPDNVTLSTAGIQRFEFYTAKDFPIRVSQTDLECMIDSKPNILALITAGFKQSSTSCYSQGYLIELNDMHGKQKAISTCPFMKGTINDSLIANVEKSGYTSRVEYYYRTKTENDVQKLENRVEVLLADGKTETKLLGQTYDFVIDQRRNHSKSIGGGVNAQFMLGNVAPPIAGASAFPSFDCFEEDVKSIATTKIIYRTGILEKTKAYNNGSVITTTNLQYDPYTGQPLLTTVTNEFEQPVYHYSMPAYWYYTNMGSAADNYRATFYGNTELPNGKMAFSQYDMIRADGCLFRIDSFSTGGLAHCWKSTGDDNINPSSGEIVCSRHSNQLSAMAAEIVSMRNAADLNNRRLPVLDAFNSYQENCFPFLDCTGDIRYARLLYQADKARLYFFAGDDSEKLCEIDLEQLLQAYDHIKYELVHLPDNFSFSDFKFIRNGPDIDIVTGDDYSDILTSFQWNDPEGLFPECMDGVLQASATELKTSWQYDYGDVNVVMNNPDYLGIPNIYRSLRANLYVTERNQTGSHNQYATNAAYDGTFASFSPFYYGRGNAGNLQKPWTWTAEITKYSPFNFEIENVNALGIYSSALYGYKNSLVTAVANNARYDEIGFDSFENDQNIPIGSKRGHIVCSTSYGTVFATDTAHSGKRSLKTRKLKVDFENDRSNLNLQTGKSYLLSCWVRKEDCPTLGNLGDVYNYTYGSITTSVSKEPKVDCWQRIEVVFTYDGSNSFELESVTGGYFYVDDIRIVPADATSKTYVYNPHDYRLLAELDENNFATFYNYDEEGVLVQVKKETERGIMTVKTTRQHYRVRPTQAGIPQNTLETPAFEEGNYSRPNSNDNDSVLSTADSQTGSATIFGSGIPNAYNVWMYTREKMDGSYYIALDNVLRLHVYEPYAVGASQRLRFCVYDSERRIVVKTGENGNVIVPDESTIQSPQITTGENWVTLNLGNSCTYYHDYYLEVWNSKGEKSFLRFRSTPSNPRATPSSE